MVVPHCPRKKKTTDAYPLPRVDDIINSLYEANIFTVLDLASGFYQIRLRNKDIAKTAFTTHEARHE